MMYFMQPSLDPDDHDDDPGSEGMDCDPVRAQ
jgi:hypothetical protein